MTKKYALKRLKILHDDCENKWLKSKSKKNKSYLIGRIDSYNDAMFIIKNIKYYKKDKFDLVQKKNDEVKIR